MPVGTFAEFASALDDHVLMDILDIYLYRENQFADDFESDTSTRHSPFTQRYRTVAKAIIPASKRLRYLGVRVLWKSILLRSDRDLKKVATLAGSYVPPYAGDTSMSQIARRLEVRFVGSFDEKVFRQLLDNLPRLEVVVFRDHSTRSHLEINACRYLSPLYQSHSHLRRVQLQSRAVVPYCSCIFRLLEGNPQLRSLRVPHLLLPNEPDESWTPTLPAAGPYRLTSLSLGNLFLRDPSSPDNPFDLLLSVLTTSFPPLRELSELELFEVTPSHMRLLEKYGSQLRRVLYAPSGLYGEHGEENGRSWADLCPNLEELHWFISGPFIERPPIEHNTLSRVKVEYFKIAWENRWECTDRVEDAIDTFRYGNFPAVEEIEVVIRGMMLPSVYDFDTVATPAEMEGVVVLDDDDGYSFTVSKDES